MGVFAAAKRVLLSQLAAAGAKLYYHGDYDWPGLVVRNHVMRVWHAQPWHFSAKDYLAAIQTSPERPCNLAPSGVKAAWDADLALTVRQHGLGIAEEAVMGVLLEPLAPAA